MDEKQTKSMMGSLKSLSYSRQAALQVILELTEQTQFPPEERLERIILVIKSTGITLWRGDNPIT